MNTIYEPLLDFEWSVHTDYVWRTWRDEDGAEVVLAPERLQSRAAIFVTAARVEKTGPVLGPLSDSQPVRHYRPLERRHATLFRIFASIDPRDRDAIRAFANAYGLLGVPAQDQAWSRNERRAAHAAYGESHLAWAWEIARMQEAIEQWNDQRTEGSLWPDMNKLVKQHLSRVHLEVRRDSAGEYRLGFAPDTLLSAMWLQLALAVVGNQEIVLCKFCSRPIEISTAKTGYRTNRAFCSDSCKTLDYRRRKRTALRLAQEGQSVRRIAKLIQTKPATVRSWLEKAKAKGSN
ncbi:MAG: helix-turn-helix domain-containing protein [Vicinamibacterales bacterium]|nr:helix-turn-helix domain-containing protein [Vicinamibacterales bacterium]HJN45669.1 helix-turn-helix domain-containing protein [Vicinamibacterales bacterium]